MRLGHKETATSGVTDMVLTLSETSRDPFDTVIVLSSGS